MKGTSLKRKSRTASQQGWVQFVATQGCIICGNGAQVHHVVGETMVHNGVPIGQEYILPLCPHHHRMVDQGADGLEQLKTDAMFKLWHLPFEEVEQMSLIDLQRQLFISVYERWFNGSAVTESAPFDQEVWDSIMDYGHK